MPSTARRNGPYAPLSATYYLDDAIIEAGPDAETLYTRMLAFCAGSPTTEGYVTDAQLSRLGAGLPRLNRRLQALLTHGPVERVPGGYQIRAWLRWNRSAGELERVRAKDRERKSERTPAGFQTELGLESDPPSERNPNGTGTGIQQRSVPRAEARAGATVQSTSVQSKSPQQQSGGGTIDQALDATGPWLPEVREALSPHLAQAVDLGASAVVCKVALVEYRNRANPKPGLLPHLLQDVLSREKPPTSRPPWCGKCDETTRLTETDAGMARCPECHPKSVEAGQ